MRSRRESSLAEVGSTPDYRFTLANERTFLAWIRTSLALLAAGVAVVHLVPSLGPRPQRLLAGLALIGLALLCAATSHRRWYQAERAIRLGEALPLSAVTFRVLGTGVSLVIVGIVVLLLAA